MSRSKKLGSIYANNRKRRIASDDESEDDDYTYDNTTDYTEDVKRNHHRDHAGNAHKTVDPVARCEAKLRSLRQHLAILRQEAAEVEKEIARWEWEAAAAVKASKVRAREAERAAGRNAHMHGYTMSGSVAQKRRRVLHHLDDSEEEFDVDRWGPASHNALTLGSGVGDNVPRVPKASTFAKNKKPCWTQAADDDDDDDHSMAQIEDMEMAMEHDTDEDSGASVWGKLVEKVPSPRADFEVVIEQPSPFIALQGASAGSVHPGQSRRAPSDNPLFFGSSDDFTDTEASHKMTPPGNPVELFSPAPKQAQNLCFSPLSLLPCTPMTMNPRSNPTSKPNSESVDGTAPPPLQIITPKRPPTTAVSSHRQSEAKRFVPSPGFFGTYEEKRKMRGLDPLPRMVFDEFEGGIVA